jgi:hypothetical protein
MELGATGVDRSRMMTMAPLSEVVRLVRVSVGVLNVHPPHFLIEPHNAASLVLQTGR